MVQKDPIELEKNKNEEKKQTKSNAQSSHLLVDYHEWLVKYTGD